MPAESISAGIFYSNQKSSPTRSRIEADAKNFYGSHVPRHAKGQSIGTSSTTSSKDSKCG